MVNENTLPTPKTTFFKSGSWKYFNDWEQELKPYYEESLRMLGAVKNPKLFDADLGLEKVVQQLNIKDKFEATVLPFFSENQIKR